MLFLGDNLLAYLVLAFGGAMAVGNLLAVVRPPERVQDGRVGPAPLRRSLVMAGIGLVAALWAVASLVS